MHDIVTRQKTVVEARDYYATEFLNARRKQPTPYMEKLNFTPAMASAADPDDRMVSDEQLAVAQNGADSGSA